LNPGPAVVDATGEIYRDVANIAARVQTLADARAVLITARVQRQVAGLFVAEERGTQTLKGVPEAVTLYLYRPGKGRRPPCGTALPYPAGRSRRGNRHAQSRRHLPNC
jgi:class 3 adenylate cyclase